MRIQVALATIAVILSAVPGYTQEGRRELIPHAQDRPPNPPKTPAEAVQAMTVPPGFTVEVVAAEPNLVNPVAMTFDEKGRIWVTESLEYPRREAGAAHHEAHRDVTASFGRARATRTASNQGTIRYGRFVPRNLAGFWQRSAGSPKKATPK